MEPKPRKREWLAIVLLTLMAWAGGGRWCGAQVIDCTVSGELADVPGAERLPLVYHLFNLGDDGREKLAPGPWAPAFERVKAGEKRVALNIEPDVSPRPDWRRPTDPKFAPLGAVTRTHEIIAQQLEPLCKEAKTNATEIWTYRLFSPTYRRNVDIAGRDPAPWKANVDELQAVKFTPRKSLAKLVKTTGGGELFEVYISDAWNVDRPWSKANCVLLLERQAAALEARGMRGIPLLNFYTVETTAPVRPEIMEALIYVAKQRGPVAVWNGYHPTTKGTKPLTTEQKALLK